MNVQFKPFSIVRGTKDFTISVSNDTATWVDVLENTLEDPHNIQCESPNQLFVIWPPREERYVRFTVRSFYHNGGGLSYIGFGGLRDCCVECQKGKEKSNVIFLDFRIANIKYHVAE